MNVLFVAGDADYSGATLSMVALIALLKKDGVNCHVILPYGGKIEAELDVNGIEYSIVPSNRWIKPADERYSFGVFLKRTKLRFKNIRAVYQIRKYIRENSIDLVHINTLAPYVGAVAALSLKCPYIWHIREFGEEDHGQTIWNKKSGYKLIEKACCILTISKSLQEKYSHVLQKANVRMIYNGLDINRYLQLDRPVFQRNIVTITISGRISEGKNQLELIKAAERLKNFFECFRIQIVGTIGKNNYYHRVKTYIREHSLGPYVKICGFKRNMEDIWGNTDICVVCSRAEAFGRVTVEAMLAGCLVVGANTAGTAEIIEDSTTGLLYQQGDSDSLAERLKYALMNKAEMQRIANKGRKVASLKFTAEDNERKILSLYREILGTNRLDI